MQRAKQLRRGWISKFCLWKVFKGTKSLKICKTSQAKKWCIMNVWHNWSIVLGQFRSRRLSLSFYRICLFQQEKSRKISAPNQRKPEKGNTLILLASENCDIALRFGCAMRNELWRLHALPSHHNWLSSENWKNTMHRLQVSKKELRFHKRKLQRPKGRKNHVLFRMPNVSMR